MEEKLQRERNRNRVSNENDANSENQDDRDDEMSTDGSTEDLSQPTEEAIHTDDPSTVSMID